MVLVFEGPDAGGKGGAIRRLTNPMDARDYQVISIAAPTDEERAHPYLWRFWRHIPGHGRITIFDRSWYGRVLVERIEGFCRPAEWRRAFAEINAFEQQLVDDGTVLVKCFLHISSAEQKERLLARLDDPTKHWKYNPGDVDVRGRWDDYQTAYADALERCSTQQAPWYVIPSDRKWYRNWAVAQLLVEHLRALDLTWPVADFDVEVEKARVAAS